MKTILKIIYRLSYFKIPDWIVEKLMGSRKMGLLKIISAKGHYKNRMMISDQLKRLSAKNQLILLETIIDDNIQVISQSGIQAAKKLKLKDSLIKKVAMRKRYWEERELELVKKRARTKELLKNSTNHKRKFSDGETYKQTKQMLKKPMNTGSWY
jgi:hypothetical protein